MRDPEKKCERCGATSSHRRRDGDGRLVCPRCLKKATPVLCPHGVVSGFAMEHGSKRCIGCQLDLEPIGGR